VRIPGASFAAWLAGLGVRTGGEDPPFVDAIQPVRVVGSDELHAPRLQTAEGTWSLDFAAIPGNQNACSILSLAPGGIIVRAFYAFAFTGTDGLFDHNVGLPAPAYTYNAAPTWESNPVDTPVRSRRNQTQPLAALPAEVTAEGMWIGGLGAAPQIASFALYGPIWVPPGRTFNVYKHGGGTNLRWGGHVRIAELEAPPSNSSLRTPPP
jgi:hypothetical protein